MKAFSLLIGAIFIVGVALSMMGVSNKDTAQEKWCDNNWREVKAYWDAYEAYHGWGSINFDQSCANLYDEKVK